MAFAQVVELMADQFNSSRPWTKIATILADNIFKCIFLNETDRIQIQISLKLFPKSPIDNKPVLVQVMACRLFVNSLRRDQMSAVLQTLLGQYHGWYVLGPDSI